MLATVRFLSAELGVERQKMNALERELETAMGLASCRGDEDKIREAMLELSHLRSCVAVLRDSAKDVIQWADDTGHDCYQMHRLNAAIALSFTPNAEINRRPD